MRSSFSEEQSGADSWLIFLEKPHSMELATFATVAANNAINVSIDFALGCSFKLLIINVLKA